MNVPLPFNETTNGDPSQEGRQRLKGAFNIDVSRIRPDPLQPRRSFDSVELEQLAASIKVHGTRQPIRVWYVAAKGIYQIISGERRYRAAIAAGLASVPCIVDDVPRDTGIPERRDLLVEQIVENWQRVDLEPLEISKALAELRDKHNLSQEELSHATGKPKSEISRLLSLQKLTPEIALEAQESPVGTLTRRHLLAVAQLEPARQAEVVARVREGKLSAVETERIAVKLKKPASNGRVVRQSGAVRRYVVGAAAVQVSFRKTSVTKAELLHVLDRVRAMVIAEEPGVDK